MKYISLLLILTSLFFSQSVESIVKGINASLQKSDGTVGSLKTIADKGCIQFERYLSKDISDDELEYWVEMYRSLENYAYQKTEKTDAFIEKTIKSNSLGSTFSERLKKVYHSKVYFQELPKNTTDIDGKPIKISDYNNKLVLIDFWATWCGPCISELPHVKEAYKKYKDKGFDIIGISLDKNNEKLKNFIQAKKMPWRQISDEKGWNSVYAKAYGIRSIPATYLLKNGKIIAKNLRGNALEKAIKENL